MIRGRNRRDNNRICGKYHRVCEKGELLGEKKTYFDLKRRKNKQLDFDLHKTTVEHLPDDDFESRLSRNYPVLR